MKYGGFVTGAYGIADKFSQYKSQKINKTELIVEQISNLIGLIPLYGTAWSIGWNLGKEYGPSTW